MRFLSLFAALCLAASLPTAGQAATTMATVEGMTATVFQEQQTSFAGLGIRFGFESDVLIQGVTFLPGVEYWRNTSRVKAYDLTTNRRDATLSLEARVPFRLKSSVPYLGVGYGIHFLTTAVEAPTLGLPRAETSLTKGGLSVLGGIQFAVGGKVTNFIEVKYHHVTDYSQVKLNFGIGYGF